MTPEAAALFYLIFSILLWSLLWLLINLLTFFDWICFFSADRNLTTINGVPGGGMYVPSITSWATIGLAKKKNFDERFCHKKNLCITFVVVGWILQWPEQFFLAVKFYSCSVFISCYCLKYWIFFLFLGGTFCL